MRRIIHISDMHFGRFDESFLEPLIKTCNDLAPDLIVVSGDFTQRARKNEFLRAQYFLSQLQYEYFIIPGNHDIMPLYRLPSRLKKPFERYMKYITPELEPTYTDDEIAIVGINTVRATKISSGRMHTNQLKKTADFFKQYPDHYKIVVTHHPIDLPFDYHKKKLVGSAKLAIREFAKNDVNMFLSGHFHVSAAVNAATRNSVANYAPLMVQAGTVSLRQRGERQSFNLITIASEKVAVESYVWDISEQRFVVKVTKNFQR